MRDFPLYLIPLLPICGFLFNLFIGPKLSLGKSHFVAYGTVFGSFLLTLNAFLRLLDDPGQPLGVYNRVARRYMLHFNHVSFARRLAGNGSPYPTPCQSAILIASTGRIPAARAAGYMPASSPTTGPNVGEPPYATRVAARAIRPKSSTSSPGRSSSRPAATAAMPNATANRSRPTRWAKDRARLRDRRPDMR